MLIYLLVYAILTLPIRATPGAGLVDIQALLGHVNLAAIYPLIIRLYSLTFYFCSYSLYLNDIIVKEEIS